MDKLWAWVKDQDWLILMPGAILLVVGSWPIGHHQWSFVWLSIIIVILLWEVASRYLFPEKKTISNVFRDFRKAHPVLAWILIGGWMLFAVSLAFHLAV